MRIDLQNITNRKFSSGVMIGESDSSKIVIDLNDNDRICIVNDQGSLFSSSYLLGLLMPLMDKFPDAEAFKAKLDIGGLDHTNRLEIMRAINRYYHSERLKVG